MITIGSSGSTKNTEAFLNSISNATTDITQVLNSYGQKGVDALRAATPVDTGLTADLWGYEVVTEGNTTSIYWTNANTVAGTNVAILIQYDHATGTGGFVEGRDYINPAIRSIFDQISGEVWKKVTSK